MAQPACPPRSRGGHACFQGGTTVLALNTIPLTARRPSRRCQRLFVPTCTRTYVKYVIIQHSPNMTSLSSHIPIVEGRLSVLPPPPALLRTNKRKKRLNRRRVEERGPFCLLPPCGVSREPSSVKPRPPLCTSLVTFLPRNERKKRKNSTFDVRLILVAPQRGGRKPVPQAPSACSLLPPVGRSGDSLWGC